MAEHKKPYTEEFERDAIAMMSSLYGGFCPMEKIDELADKMEQLHNMSPAQQAAYDAGVPLADIFAWR